MQSEQLSFDFGDYDKRISGQNNVIKLSFIQDADGRIAYIGFKEEQYLVGTIKGAKHYDIEDNSGYTLPYSIGPFRINNSPFSFSHMSSDEYYFLWVLKNGIALFERRKNPETFVSELWELKHATRRLDLELILK